MPQKTTLLLNIVLRTVVGGGIMYTYCRYAADPAHDAGTTASFTAILTTLAAISASTVSLNRARPLNIILGATAGWAGVTLFVTLGRSIGAIGAYALVLFLPTIIAGLLGLPAKDLLRDRP